MLRFGCVGKGEAQFALMHDTFFSEYIVPTPTQTHTHTSRRTKMPFLGLATTGDLKKATEKASECSMVLNGIHVCSSLKDGYESVEPKDFRFSDLVESETKKCLHFADIPDVVGTATANKISGMIGHGDIPDNYLCFDPMKTKQYFDAIVPDISKKEAIAMAKQMKLHDDSLYE